MEKDWEWDGTGGKVKEGLEERGGRREGREGEEEGGGSEWW
jgi:hypothetical protein